MKRRERWIGLLGWMVLVVLAAMAQQPRVTSAKMETRSAAQGLEKTFQAIVTSAVAPAWVGYAVPIIPGRHQMCCGYVSSDDERQSNCCGRCRLERGRDDVNISSGNSVASDASGTVKLEGPNYLLVLLRIEQKRVGHIRTFSETCELDAGGLPFFWLTDVRPAESVALLSSFATAEEAGAEDDDHLYNHAVTAIAFHADPSADRALESFVAPTRPESLRGHVAFWLGAARGRPGYELLRRMLREDSSDRVRDKAVFALSISKVPEALATLIDTARNDTSPHVRGQALFWLAHMAGKKAAAAITEAIEKDPETEVKKHAVFALSQLPKDEGVPLLIQVARTNSNPVVRKQAMFWLGQSNDPRALAFFEQVLTQK